jgi:hypothetical protein
LGKKNVQSSDARVGRAVGIIPSEKCIHGDTSHAVVREVATSTTYLLNVNRTGRGGGNELSSAPIIEPDGRTVLFQSFASDLTEGDRNNNRDVFLVRLGTGDSDADGLADDWEVTYFNDLSRDGSGDLDGDGLSDFSEYRAGTNPSSDASLLRVISITVLGTEERTLIWSATPGKSYRVQFKDGFETAWQDLSAATSVSGVQGFASDTTAPVSGNRFYRVVVLP